MWTLALPLVQVLFQRGNFTLEDAQKTASVVRIYSLLLLASSLHKVTVPSFYAIKNTWLPALTSAISLCLHIFVANIWVDQFGLSGLVGSTALATYFNMTLVLLAYHFFIGPLHFFQLLKSILHMLPATLLMGLGVFYFYPFMENTLAHFFLFPESLARLTALFTNIFLGAFIYFLLSYLLKQPDTQRAWTQIKKRLKPR
ncbi:MAG: hypothetical protein D6797_07820 [Bdellovibrio sp.]|nr:MAG: hypothetical protein D6797_07820 [Bdellovibrio sp.]